MTEYNLARFNPWDRVKAVREGPNLQCLYTGSHYGTVMRVNDEGWCEVLLDGMCCTWYHTSQLEKAEPQQHLKPQQVYVAFFGIYSDRCLVGVYSTREAANEGLLAYMRRRLHELHDEDSLLEDLMHHEPRIDVVDLDRVEAMGWGDSHPTAPFQLPRQTL